MLSNVLHSNSLYNRCSTTLNIHIIEWIIYKRFFSAGELNSGVRSSAPWEYIYGKSPPAVFIFVHNRVRENSKMITRSSPQYVQ